MDDNLSALNQTTNVSEFLPRQDDSVRTTFDIKLTVNCSLL